VDADKATNIELQKRIAELETIVKRTDVLFSIAEAGVKSSNLEELLNIIVEKVAQGTSANRVTLITFNWSVKKIEHFVRGGAGAKNIDTSVTYEELMEGLSGWAINNRKSALSPKDKPDPRESVAVQQRRRETNCGAIIVSPLQVHGEILGTITAINNPEDLSFTKRDVLLIEAAAGQAASAILKTRLYQELDQANQLLKEHTHKLEKEIFERKQAEAEIINHADQLTALNKLSRDIVSTFDLDEIYVIAHQTVERLMPVDAFYISLVDEHENEAEDVYLYDKGKIYPNDRISLSIPTLTTHVINSGKSLLIKDDADGISGVYGVNLFGTLEDTRSVLVVPLVGKNKVIGVISAQNYEPNMYSSVHTQLLELLANQVAIAILNARLHATLQQEAIRDPLTSLFNRRFMEETLEKEILRAKRNSMPLAVALIDIDHFKRINDRFGHDAGDMVLKMLARLIEDNIRSGDVACRYGGEEFALVMPGVSLEHTYKRMEELRNSMRHIPFSYREMTMIPLSCSIGISIYPDHGEMINTLLKAADMALYRAKKGGRNRVVTA